MTAPTVPSEANLRRYCLRIGRADGGALERAPATRRRRMRTLEHVTMEASEA